MFRRTATLALLVPLLAFAMPMSAQTAPDPSPPTSTAQETAHSTGPGHANLHDSAPTPPVTSPADVTGNDTQDATLGSGTATQQTEQNVERSSAHIMPASIMRVMDAIDRMSDVQFVSLLCAAFFALLGMFSLFSRRGGDEDDDNARGRYKDLADAVRYGSAGGLRLTR